MNKKNEFAPIVLFVYNRPEHTQLTIRSLLANSEAKESLLYVYSDGPKSDASDTDLKKIMSVRNIVNNTVGFKDVIIKESPVNRGLATSTICGMSNVFANHDRAIMIEDDDVVTPYFLSYINACLERYEDDETIWSVCGYTDTNYIESGDCSDLFLVNRPSSWGFGTWRRCWDKIIWDVDTLKGIFAHKSVIKKFNRWGGYDSSRIMFALFNGKASSWSIRYNFAAYLNNCRTIIPTKSLVANIGFDGSGTHCSSNGRDVEILQRPVVIPEVVSFDSRRNAQLKDSFFSKSRRYLILKKLGLFDLLDPFINPYKLDK